jgi:hypothetical protein
VSLRLTTAFWNYDRTQALVDGRVKVEGCELDIELLRPEITFCAPADLPVEQPTKFDLAVNPRDPGTVPSACRRDH